MTDTITWQLLFVDDDLDICRQVKEFLEGETVVTENDHLQVKTLNDFPGALDELESCRFDLLILDVRLGPYDIQAQEEEKGIKTLKDIQQRRFLPVVFYTGLPNLVQTLETPLIRVAEKTAGLPNLLEIVRSIFETRLPAVNRALIRHMEAVQRDYMWEFVARHWKQFGDTSDRTALAYLLARRLAMSLSGPGIRQLAQDLGDPGEITAVEDRIHPMQYYVIPPVNPFPMTGDLYQGQIGDQTGHWILLTPSCDLVTGREKAIWVLMARSLSLSEESEYKTWQAGLPQPSSRINDRLKALLQNRREGSQPERFYFLPGALTLPDLVVDFQQLMTLPREQIGKLDRLASLDSPFAEALLARFTRYFGRMGTPDLDVEAIVSRLRTVTDESVQP